MKKNKHKKRRPKVSPKPLPARAGGGGGGSAAPEKGPKEERASLKRAVLLWASLAAVTLGLLGGVQTLVELAAPARWLVANWQWLIESAWRAFFGLFNVDFVPEAAGPVTFFFAMLGIGLAGMHLEQTEHPPNRTSLWKFIAQQQIHVRFTEGVAIAICALVIYRETIEFLVFGSHFNIWNSRFPWLLSIQLGLAMLVFVLLGILEGVYRAAHALLLTVFVSLFYVLISLPSAYKAQASGPESVGFFRAAVLDLSVFYLPAHIGAFLTYARPRYVNYRFAMVLLTLVAIVALNYLSLLILSFRNPG